MSTTHDEELSLKSRYLARALGASVSLSSHTDVALGYFHKFKNNARNVSLEYRKLISLVADLKHITHEVEAIFDNFFVVEAAIFEFKNNVRKEDFKKLPLVLNKDKVLVPRLYHILSSLVEETNQIVDKDILTVFLSKYQEYSPLSIRELYAIPSILQIVSIEHFGKLINHSIQSLKEYEDAEVVYKKIKKEISKKSHYEFSKITSELASRYNIIPLSFGFYLSQKLSQEGSVMRPVIKWIKLNFEKQGIDARHIADLESKQRNENSVSASNIIESLHWLTQTRWDDIVEEINVVDSILAKDPAGAYSGMDIESRSMYRRIIVRIAERAGIHEAEVARGAVRLALGTQTTDSRRKDFVPGAHNHVGYYLLDGGMETLEQKVGYKPSLSDSIYRFITRNPERNYFGLLFSLNFLFTAGAVFYLANYINSLGMVWLGGVLFFFVNTEVVLSVLNVSANRFLQVRRLPKLDLSKSVSDKQRTFVIVPSMFRNIEGTIDMVRKLEIRYLANSGDNIFFALLLDFKDSKVENLPGEDLLVAAVEKEIEILNTRYGNREKKFFFLYRKRVFNPSEGVYMGWERKRGKLREFNMLLRGKTGTTYVNESSVAHIPYVKYVITLDEDTELPKDSAIRLIGCIDHPLNRPVLSANGDFVERGYGIIQPSVSVRLALATRSLFSRLYSSNSGVDSYSSAVSDVYQDLFGSALFFGKGIYDVDAVEKTMDGKIPDNMVLSHDLLEGIYANTGFASDIVLFDGFPKFYHEFIARLHRWIRGDWQIIGWLKVSHKPKGVEKETSGFSMVDRWKIIDNLRRSLMPLVSILFLVYGIFVDLSTTVFSVYVIFALGSPFIIALVNDIFSLKRIPFVIRFNDTLWQIKSAFTHTFLRLALLLHQAMVSISAISITLWRLYVSKKHLLQWQISADVGQKLKGRLFEYIRTMWVTETVCLVFLLILYSNSGWSDVMIFWGLVWLVSPVVGFLISIPKSNKEHLGQSDYRMLRSLAFRTSNYFLNFPQKENNWLIQDHYQELPKVTESSRLTTSPTNIGMLFASLYSCYSFGYLSMDNFIDRTKRAFVSLKKLERFNGHLYNWYDIERLEPLAPKYVSSVDSANFLLALISTRQGIRMVQNEPIVNKVFVQAFGDGLWTLLEELEVLSKKSFVSKVVKKAVRNLEQQTRKAYEIATSKSFSKNLKDMYSFLVELHPYIINIEKALVDVRTQESISGADAVYIHAERVINLLEEDLGFIRYVAPYIISEDVSIKSYASRDEKLFASYSEFINLINKTPSLYELKHSFEFDINTLDFRKVVAESSLAPEAKGYVFSWYDHVIKEVKKSKIRASEFLVDIEYLDAECSRYIDEADFSFLYNKERGLFHIGYNATFNRIDRACYNFLASESNSVSFVAVLKNQAPQKHWFYLSRKLVRAGSEITLVSWGGSLFEYLTSLIFFNTHPESLLGKTSRSAIRVHQKHAKKFKTAWGMGESAYRAFDIGKHYQYQVFGSPQLGLKRGLADYLVVAPYTSALSLPLKLKDSSLNIRRLKGLGALGAYGFYDAIDYMNQVDGSRTRPSPTNVYYAHHQGFTLLSLHNVLLDRSVKDLFHTDPRVASLEILLEEKMPRTPAAIPLATPVRLAFKSPLGTSDSGVESKTYIPVKTPEPRYSFISNGAYSLGISNAGAGWSKYNGVSLTRFRDDSVLEEYGRFFYIKDNKTKTVWSPTTRPVGAFTKGQKVIFHENKAEFFASYGNLDSRLEITVDSKNPVEVQVLTFSNKGASSENITVSSFGEVSLALQNQDVHHPQYQKLLVKSEFVPEYNALVYSRPHPADRTRKIYFAHMIAQNSWKKTSIKVCADKESFVGRYGSMAKPVFLNNPKGVEIREFTLDPIFSLSKTVDVRPGETIALSFVNIAHENKEELWRLMRLYRKARDSQKVMNHSVSESAVSTKRHGLTQEMAVIFQDLASHIISGKSHVLNEETPTSSSPYINSLWKLGISGDYPLVVMIIKDIEDMQSVKYALTCHSYWKSKGLEIDFLILNQEPASYIKMLDDEIDFLMRQSKVEKIEERGSSVHHIKSDLVSDEDKKVLLYVARLVMNSKDGNFKQQVRASLGTYNEKPLPRFVSSSKPVLVQKVLQKLPEGLILSNSVGGFDPARSEYVMAISSDSMPPVPWTNIIAQKDFGSVITEAGATYTWSEDSYDNRVTEWSNEPLLFKSSEIMYIRDEDTGELWNPTPLPVATKDDFIVRHGKGYSVFEHTRSNIEHSYEVSVSLSDRVKVSTLRIKNKGKKRRSLSFTFFVEPAMGAERNHSRDSMLFSHDVDTKIITFKNSVRSQLPGRVGAIDLCNGEFSFSTNKSEFFGRHGSYEAPAALKRVGLSNNLYRGTHNSITLQSVMELLPGEEKEITCLIAESENDEQLKNIISTYRVDSKRKAERNKVDEFWKKNLSVVRIETPDVALNTMFNHQLLYQALSSRLWAKTGFYQPSGAFGFRDQLQDITAFIWSDPVRVREFLLKAASHQFKEGDGLNWWHDHNMFGVRSILSDHQLWLPYAVSEYVKITKDTGILDEVVPFLEGPLMSFAYQKEWAGTPSVSSESGTLFDHCIRAIEKSFALGSHGLPLMGMSDWNDGLSKVGVNGRGESVWVGWFLLLLIDVFTPYLENRGDMDRVEKYKSYSEHLQKSIEKNAWDGKWYRRAFLDSGIALGSRKLREFKLDSIAQSWSVLSGKARPDRSERAMKSAFTELFDGNAFRLLTPALETTPLDPGYVKDYPPGVRENGSQYNHATLWAAQALFKQGKADSAKKILDLVNPFIRTSSLEKVSEYRSEPYVVASDIYAKPSYGGRAGWSWYTGSAGVMYRTILDAMCGFNLSGDILSFTPSLPSSWTSVKISFKKNDTVYDISFEKPEGFDLEVSEIYMDEVIVDGGVVKLVYDRKIHTIKVVMKKK